MRITKVFLASLKANPIKEVAGLELDDLAKLIQKADEAYHTKGEPIIDDATYDKIRDYLASLSPAHPVLKRVGAPGGKTALPYFMGSMNKNKAIDKFKAEYLGSYVISDKLDGVSALFYKTPNSPPRLYTRGDGIMGQDITHLIPHIKGLKELTDLPPALSVRGELIISKAKWDPSLGANARNMVAGLVNAKVPNMVVASKVEFVAYSVYDPPLAQSQQLELLHSLGFIPVFHTHIKHNQLTETRLNELLEERRTHSPYEIDGIIVSADIYKPVLANGNPDHAFAFKNTVDSATSKVTDVIWTPSKDGRLVPVVIFEPVSLAGVTITKATGHNGDFIKTHNIGKGATVEIMRSGDVIPYIKSVPKPTTAQMPTMAYEWNGKDIFATEASDDQNLSVLSNFFRKADIPNMRDGNIKKLYNAGYKTVGEMVRLKASDIAKIPGMGTKIGEALAESLALVKELPCQKLMDASNAFGRGFGEKRLTLLLYTFPNALTNPPTMDELLNVDGIGDIIAEEFLEGLKAFKLWQETEGISCTAPTVKESRVVTIPPNSKLANQYIVFSGYRPTDQLKSKLQSHGVTIEENVSKKVALVVTKDKIVSTTKTEKAKKLNIKIISHDELIEMMN